MSHPPFIVEPGRIEPDTLENIRPNKAWLEYASAYAQVSTQRLDELDAQRGRLLCQAQVQAFREVYDEVCYWGKDAPPAEKLFDVMMKRQGEIYEALCAQWVVEHGT